MVMFGFWLAMFVLMPAETKAAAFNPNWTQVEQVGRGAGVNQIDEDIFAPGRCDQEKALEVYAVEVQWKTGQIKKLYICSERIGPVRMKIQTDDIFDLGRCKQENALQIYALEVQWKKGNTEKLYICSERIGPVRMKMETLKIGINRAAQGVGGVVATISIVNQQDLSANIRGLVTTEAAFNPNLTVVGQVGRGADDYRTAESIFAPGRCDQEKALEIYAVEVQWKMGHIEKLYVCSERNGPVRMKIQADDIFDLGRCNQENTLQIYALEVQWKTGNTEKLYICSERIGPVRMKMETVKIGIYRGPDVKDGVVATIPIINQQDLSANIRGLVTTEAAFNPNLTVVVS